MFWSNSNRKISTCLNEKNFVPVRFDPSYIQDKELVNLNREYVSVRYSNGFARVLKSVIKSAIAFFTIPFVLNLSGGISNFMAYGIFYVALKFFSDMLHNLDFRPDDVKFENFYFKDNSFHIRKKNAKDKKPDVLDDLDDEEKEYYKFSFKNFKRLSEYTSFSVFTSMFFMRFFGDIGIAAMLGYCAIDIFWTSFFAHDDLISQTLPVVGILASFFPSPPMRFATIAVGSFCAEIMRGFLEDENMMKAGKFRGFSLQLINSVIDKAFPEDEPILESFAKRIERHKQKLKPLDVDL